MSPYRHPDPAVRKEMWRRRWAHCRQHPLRRYGQDSLRRARPQQDAADAKARVRRHLAALIVLTAAAIGIIGWDYEARHRTLDLPRPADVTSTSAPHPATTGSHP